MPKLPDSISTFVEQFPMLSNDVASVPRGLSSYRDPTYRSACAMLLSGRIGACKKDWPLKGDINRLVRGTSVDPYSVVRAGAFLKTAAVLSLDNYRYRVGPNFNRFWGDDPTSVYEIAREAVVRWIDGHSPYNMFRRDMTGENILDMLTLFFSQVRDRELPACSLDRKIGRFARLPIGDLERIAKRQQLDIGREFYWQFDHCDKAAEAAKSALSISEWIVSSDERVNPTATISPVGLEMLGLEPLSPFPPLDTRLLAQSDRSIFAGAGRPIEELAILFRCCKPVGIDHVLEFKIDSRRLQTLRPDEIGDLRALLAQIELPSTIRASLETAMPKASSTIMASNDGGESGGQATESTASIAC